MTDWPKPTPEQISALQSLCHLVLLRGIELGLEAAATHLTEGGWVPEIRDLNPETIAKEAQHD